MARRLEFSLILWRVQLPIQVGEARAFETCYQPLWDFTCICDKEPPTQREAQVNHSDL